MLVKERQVDKIIRKIDNDGYKTEYVDYKDIADKLDELIEGYNELELRHLRNIERTAKIEEKIIKRIEKLENASKTD